MNNNTYKYLNSTTLLGYFKYHITAAGETTKYFNRAFLNTYITEYKQSHKNGRANYPETMKTDFYNKNSTAYCVFLEIYETYRKNMDRIKAAG